MVRGPDGGRQLPPRDLAVVTEHPGRTVGRDQFQVICKRYAFAAGFVAGRSVLEVGCGAGMGLGALARRAAYVVGGEISTANLNLARTTYGGRPRPVLVKLDAHALPFQGGALDAVVAMAVLYYLDAHRFLEECQRVLGPGGLLLFCTPNRYAPGFRPGKFTTTYYSVPELERILIEHGFAVELWGGFPALGGGAHMTQRLIALGGTLLAGLPLPAATAQRLREGISRLLGYERCFLMPELGEEELLQVEGIPLIPLARGQPNTEFRVIYGAARLRR